MKNDNCFNTACAIIFAELIEHFPSPQTLNVWELVPNDEGERNGEFSDASKFRILMADTIRFLIQEGFIRGTPQKDNNNAQFYDVILTGKGLEKLRETPTALQDKKQPLGEAITEWVKDSGKDSAKNYLGEIFKGLFTLVQ